jgi:hypothetical protein
MTYPSHSPLGDSRGQARPQASSAEDSRERAIRLLTDAYAYDVITDFEFERRLGQLSLNATPAMIDSLVADLAPRSSGLVRDAVPGYALAPTEGRIVGFMSETRRKGPWRVPQHLFVRAIMSDMKIDLRYAAMPPGCTIEVKAVMSSVSIIVPPGLIVAFNIDPFMGNAGSDADDRSLLGHGQPHLNVFGSAIMAEVRVRVRGLTR